MHIVARSDRGQSSGVLPLPVQPTCIPLAERLTRCSLLPTRTHTLHGPAHTCTEKNTGTDSLNTPPVVVCTYVPKKEEKGNKQKYRTGYLWVAVIALSPCDAIDNLRKETHKMISIRLRSFLKLYQMDAGYMSNIDIDSTLLSNHCFVFSFPHPGSLVRWWVFGLCAYLFVSLVCAETPSTPCTVVSIRSPSASAA